MPNADDPNEQTLPGEQNSRSPFDFAQARLSTSLSGFPVEVSGVDTLHAVFLKRKPHTRMSDEVTQQEIRIRSGRDDKVVVVPGRDRERFVHGALNLPQASQLLGMTVFFEP